jgi:hypothetical protein
MHGDIMYESTLPSSEGWRNPLKYSSISLFPDLPTGYNDNLKEERLVKMLCDFIHNSFNNISLAPMYLQIDPNPGTIAMKKQMLSVLCCSCRA